ncbi:MAG: thiamine pyrophosphate-dependent enzyme [Anaerolineae bacterium]|nr:thiamine pyrophosphate-dependent enzyme [Candidatus Roseilinea sp.]MDW8448507.1 thiamine pyrophosphate-dependent enzyme [Anaerolineae bacterium]
MIFDVVMPALGATGGDVTIQEWLVQPGQRVEAGTPLVVVETDKATVEVEAFRAGYVRELLAKPGDAVSIGAVVARLTDSMEALTETPVAPLPSTRSTREHESTEVKASAGKLGVSKLPAKASASNRLIPDDATEISADLLLSMFRQMVLIRRFEDHLYQLFLQGLVPGTLHQSQGQEAIAVGVCAALRRDDVIFSTHRPVAHVIAKGGSVNAIAAELWGKATGCARGKGGQMHLTDVAVGVMPTNAIVGANVPIATGAALGFRLMGTDRVAVSFFGDGAVNTGAMHEGVNLAAVKDAPVIFVCENNQYAASTHISHNLRIATIAERAKAYGIPGFTVDGMDVVAVYESARAAVARARRGEGPTLLEYTCYRYMGHSRGDPGNYRSKQEMAEWRSRDPIPKCRALLLNDFGQDERTLDEIEAECQAEVEAAVAFAMSSHEPAPEEALRNAYTTWPEVFYAQP